MIFLFSLLFSGLLIPFTVLAPFVFGHLTVWGAALLDAVSCAMLLFLTPWFVETYEPRVRLFVLLFGVLQGVRLVSGFGAALIIGLLLFGHHEVLTLLLTLPVCVGLCMNAIGLEYIPARLSAPRVPSAVGPDSESPALVLPPEAGPTDGAMIDKKFEWKYNNAPYSVQLLVRREIYQKQKAEERVLDPAIWPQRYVAGGITGELHELATRIGRLGKSFGSYEEVSLALEFVQQTVTYTSDVGEYPRYPIETLVEGKGDCEDVAILAAALLQCMGYQSALMYLPGHAALGVAGTPGLEGVYRELDGTRYYYCEMTATGWTIGELPKDMNESDLTVALIPPLPLKVVRPPDGQQGGDER